MSASLIKGGRLSIKLGLPLKISALVIAMISVLCIFCILNVSDDSSAESSGTCGDNCTWSLSDDGVLTISGDGKMTDYSYGSSAPWYSVRSSVRSVVISDGVTTIGYYAFYGCTSLTSVNIPDSVTSIGFQAFSYCASLTNVTIPDSVTSIEWGAFYFCTSLISVTIPDSVTSIGDNAFYGSPLLTSIDVSSDNMYYCSIHGVLYTKDMKTLIRYPIGNTRTFFEIPDTVTIIEEQAFSGCTSLTSVTIGDSVISIGYNAFYGCTSLTSVTIPDSVTFIGRYAFEGCTALSSFDVSSSNKSYCSVQGVLYTKDMKSLIQYPIGNTSTSFEIPDTVTTIEDEAFYKCTSLTSVTVGDSVTSIGYDAFYGCASLTSITIPDSVTSIGSYAFYGCTSLKEVTNNSILNIVKGSTDFGYVGYYAETVIGSLLTGISGDYEVTYNELSKVCCIDKYTGSDSDILIYELTIDGKVYKVISIGASAFSECTAITSVTIGDSVKSIGSSAFYGCTSLTKVTVGNSVTSLGNDAFYGCSSLAMVILPGSLTSIGNYAFYGCTFLVDVVLPDSVTYIGFSAFHGCASLTSITIPGSVTYIGYWAFRGCSSLTSIEVSSDNSYYCSVQGVLYTKDMKLLVQYPAGSASTYFEIPDTVTSIESYVFSGCTSLSRIFISGSVTNFIDHSSFLECSSVTSFEVSSDNGSYCSVQGVLYSKDMKTLVQYPAGNTSTSFEIPDTVTSIGDCAFYGCTYLASVTIPGSVTSIGAYAFSMCNSLSSFEVSSDNEYYCSIQGVLYTKDMKTLVLYPVGNIRTFFEIPDTVTSICDYSFLFCTYLTTVSIPDTVTSIGSYAFYGCTSLTSISIPDSVTSIGNCAFYGCTSLTSVAIGESATSIEWGAFYHCTFYDEKGSVIDPQSAGFKGHLYHGADCSRLTMAESHSPGEVAIDNMVDSTCTSAGSYDSVVCCSVCGYEIFRTSVVTEKKGHSPVDDVAVAATCTSTGLTVGSHCSVCNMTLVEQKVVDKIAHNPVIDEAVAATCTATGLSEGSHCSVCNATIVAQKVLDKIAHTPVADAAVEATCTTTGLSEGSHCSVCGATIVAQKILAKVPSAEVGKDGKSYSATVSDAVAYLSSTSIDELVEKAKADPEVTLTVTTASGVFYLDNKALSNLKSSDSKIDIVRLDSKDYEDVVGSSYIYEITFGDNHDNFDGGTITVTVPYSGPTDNLKVYYLAGGKVCETLDCTYADGYVTFKVTHLSTFAVVNQAQDAGSSGNTVVIAAVVIVLLAAVALFGVTRMRRRSS